MGSYNNIEKKSARSHAGHDKRRMSKSKKILTAALALFREKGFTEVSVREIAANAGVSPVTVFTYFGDKQELIRETIRSYLSEHGRTIIDISSSSLPLSEKLIAIVEAKVILQKDFSGELLEELRQSDPEFAGEIMSGRAKGIRDSMKPLLEAGKQSGIISQDLDIEALIVFFDVVGVGMALSPGFSAYTAKDSEGFRKIVKVALLSVSPDNGTGFRSSSA